MKIVVGTDHRGTRLKNLIIDQLAAMGHEATECAPPPDAEVSDYPDYAEAVARAVAEGRAERGILACGTGIGMAMAANKVHGVRAAVVWDLFTARRSREHNDANVLCLGNDLIADVLACEIVKLWMETPAEPGRHRRRVEKIMDIEAREARRGG